MKRTGILVATALMTASFTAPALAAHTHVATPSTWKLNVGESTFGGGPTMKSDQMIVTTDTDKWLKYTDVTVDGDGKTTKSGWNGPQDGTMKPVTGMPGTMGSFKTADDSSHWVMADGSVTDTTETLSPDKKKMTLNATLKMKDGKQYHQTWVYDRVK